MLLRPDPVMLECGEYALLAEAIILRAVNDYRAALRGRKTTQHIVNYTKHECEKFFRSKWFSTLTRLDGNALIASLKEELEEERGNDLS